MAKCYSVIFLMAGIGYLRIALFRDIWRDDIFSLKLSIKDHFYALLQLLYGSIPTIKDSGNFESPHMTTIEQKEREGGFLQDQKKLNKNSNRIVEYQIKLRKF